MSLKTVDGSLNIISGASRSGKTALTVKLVTKRHKQAFVWDTQGQWSQIKGYKRVAGLREFWDICKNGKAGRWCYIPRGDLKLEFDVFCAAVYHYAEVYQRPCAVVAEELADVTTIGKAPQHWGILLRRSLKYGCSIYPISQRWAEADKTAIGNASDFYIFRSVGRDVDYLNKVTRVNLQDLIDLKPLEYIHYDAITGLIDKKVTLFK